MSFTEAINTITSTEEFLASDVHHTHIDTSRMRVAIVHYWLVGMRGGEKVIEALCRMYPEADVFTHVYVPEAVSEEIRRNKVTTSFIGRLPRAAKLYQRYLPLMPLALEQLDLRGYDLIISSESGPAKGVIPPPGAMHICYCHSPMRYIWNMFHEYRERSGPITRFVMPALAHYIRNWDSISASRVDHFIANSETVAARLHRYYRRASTVIHPPVDVDAFEVLPAELVEDYCLMVGELVGYKRPELAVEAFNRTGQRLVVIGGGEMLAELLQRLRRQLLDEQFDEQVLGGRHAHAAFFCASWAATSSPQALGAIGKPSRARLSR